MSIQSTDITSNKFRISHSEMKRGTSSHSHCDEKLRSSRIEEDDTGLRSRVEDERLRRRREWMIQQKKERDHERLKKKMILEFEMRRAREKGLPLPKIKDSDHSRSKSRSRSPKEQHRRTTASTPTTSILSKKLDSSSGTTPLFRGPEGTEISAADLRGIKIAIHRNTPGKATTGELQRDIVAPENVMLKRREDMKQAISSHLHYDEELIYSTTEEDYTSLYSGRLRRGHEWKIEQKMKQEHKRQKKTIVLEYEIQRAHGNGLTSPLIKESHYSRSKSRSRSPKDQHRRTAAASMPTTSILSKKLDSSSGTTTLFRELESTETGAAKQQRIIIIDIHEDISGKTTTGELQQAIVVPENAMLERREGEGSKPIFEREEIKVTKPEETKEHRTVVAIDSDNLGMKAQSITIEKLVGAVGKDIAVDIEVENTTKEVNDMVDHTTNKKKVCGTVKVIKIVPIRWIKGQKDGIETPITDHLKTIVLIESIEIDQENGLGIGHTEIGLENVEYHTTLNKFLFPFIIVISPQDQ